MNKVIKISSIFFTTLFLSACSLGTGNDGGIYRSDDGGKSFSPKNKAENNKTINAVDVLSLAINPRNSQEVYIGTKASGLFKTEDAGELWKQIKVSDVTPAKIYSLALDRFNPKTVFAAAVLGSRGKIMKSHDGGETWKETYTEPADGSLVLSLAIDPQNSQNIFAGTDQGQIIFSQDSGETWQSVFWTREGKAVYKIAFDNFDSNVAYFVIFQSGVLRTLDEGKNFEELKQKTDSIGSFEMGQSLQNPVSIKTDPSRDGWVYVGTSDGLLRSKDKGDNWEIVKTLNKTKDFDVRSIDINPTNSDELICTAAQTFYKSNDGGVNWLAIQSGSNRTLEVVWYDPQNADVIFAGLNKR
ncbi:MAG: YCF48-related protein [Patescibacteria group bacterium]|nr:YCF48-related protein [Patescibacteria group bacterium]